MGDTADDGVPAGSEFDGDNDGSGVPLTPHADKPTATDPVARPRRSVRREMAPGVGIEPTIAEARRRAGGQMSPLVSQAAGSPLS